MAGSRGMPECDVSTAAEAYTAWTQPARRALGTLGHADMLIDARTCHMLYMLFDIRRLGLCAGCTHMPPAGSHARCGSTRVEWVYVSALPAPLPALFGHSHDIHHWRRLLVPAIPGPHCRPSRIRLSVAPRMCFRGLSAARHGVF